MVDAPLDSNALLDAVFGSIDAGVCVLRQDGLVLRANQYWLDAMQLTAAAVEQSLAELAPQCMRAIATALRADPIGPHTLPPRPRPAGGVWHDRLSVFDHAGTRLLVITTREAVDDETEQLHAVWDAIEALPIGVGVIELQGEGFRAITRNGVLRRMLGGDSWKEGVSSPPPDGFFMPDRMTRLALRDWPGMRAAQSGKHVLETRVHALRPDGGWNILEVSAVPVRSKAGSRPRAVVVAIDQTERARAEDALGESEATYRTAFANIRDAVVLLEVVRDGAGAVADWRYLDANHAVAGMFGLPPEALIGRHVREMVPDPTRCDWLVSGFGRVLETGEPWGYEAQKRDREFLVRVFRIDHEKIGCAAVDVTELKAVEASLRRSERQLRQLVEHTPAGIAMLDRQMRYLAVSRRYVHDYRLDPDAIIGRSVYEVFPHMPEGWREIHQRCLAGAVERCEEDQLPQADGTVDWLQWELQPWHEDDGSIGGLVVFAVLITERKQAADRLRAAKERLRVTLSSIGDGVIATDEDNRVTLLNGVSQQLTGWSEADAIGKPLREIFQVVDEDDGRPVPNPADRALAEGIIVGLGNRTALIARDGVHRPIADSAAPIRDADGVITGAVLVFRDQTDERRVAQALERSRAELFALIEKLPSGVFVSDGDRILYANPTFAGYCGRAPQALIGCELSALAPDGARGLPEAGEEWAVRGLDDTIVTLECSAARAIEFDGKPARLWACRDLSQLKAMQAQLIHSDRLATVGMLAAGVAHEINNPLAFVIGALDLISERLDHIDGKMPADERKEIAECVRDARHGSLRVKAIVHDLKAFSRTDQNETAPLELAPLLESAISMAAHEIRSRAQLVRDFAHAPRVLGNEARLGQVFLNLIVNAAHAIPEGRAMDNEIRVMLREDAKGRAVVEVRDTGAGIPANIAKRIFDPFFTTKMGVGTGLGLAISRNTISALAGEITLENQPAGGTVARVTLPPTTVVESQPVASGSESSVNLRKARVLVIDDEVAICTMFRRILQRDHEVVTECDAQAACARLAAGEQFDVIFCDVTMPGMTGMDFYQRLHDICPADIGRVVFMTGGTFTTSAQDFVQRISNRCIDKPIDLAQIRHMVNQITSQSA